MGISWGRREDPDHQRHGGRRRHFALGPGERGQARLRGRPPAVHGGDQRDRPGRVRRRRDRGRGDGLPRRRRRPLVQLADPRPAGRAHRVRRADPLDRVHAVPGGRLRRRAVRRPARTRGRRSRRAQPHRQLDQLARAALQRHRRRRGRHQRRAVRHVGLPGRARHRRRCRLPGSDRAARQRASDARGQDRPRPLLRPPPLPRDRPHPARAGGRRARSATCRAPRSTTPERRAPSPWSWPRPTTPTPTATAPA